MSDLHSSDAEFDSPLPPPWNATCAPSPNVRQARRGHRCSPRGGGLDRDISLEDLAVGRWWWRGGGGRFCMITDVALDSTNH